MGMLSPTFIAMAGLLYSSIRLGLVIAFLVLNTIVVTRLLRNYKHNQHCTGCTILSNIYFINLIANWIWTGTVIYSIRNQSISPFMENVVCSLDTVQIHIVSYFFLVTLCSITVYNVAKGKLSRFSIRVMPWIVTVVLFTIPYTLTNGESETFDGFYQLGVVQSEDGEYGAEFGLMMCGRRDVNKSILGLQYALIVAPVSAVITVCGGILALRYWDVDREGCSLDLLYAPLEETKQKLLPVSTEDTKLPAKTETTFSEEPRGLCLFSSTKNTLGVILLLNMVWQCALKPLFLTNLGGTLIHLDIGTRFLIGVQDWYLALWAMSHFRVR